MSIVLAGWPTAGVEPPLLLQKGIFECQRFESAPTHHLILRVRPIDGISQQSNVFRLGKKRSGPDRRFGKGEIIWAGLDGHDVLCDGREMGAIPALSLVVEPIEKMDLLAERGSDARMLG